MDKTPALTGYVEFQKLDDDGNVIDSNIGGENGSNLVLNNMREWIPRLLAPRIITGRTDNSPGLNSWFSRRIALIGFGVGDNQDPPSVKPEEPEDGRSKLVGEVDFPNSKQGLQSPIRRIPLSPSGPSEVNQPPPNDIPGFFMYKEVDSNGITINQVTGGGAELVFTFTVGKDEYIGNIMESCLFLGGGDAEDDSLFEFDSLNFPGQFERRRLDRDNAIPIARKTRNKPLEKTRDFAFRSIWRIRS